MILVEKHSSKEATRASHKQSTLLRRLGRLLCLLALCAALVLWGLSACVIGGGGGRCNTSADCSGASSACINGRCGNCTTNADCPVPLRCIAGSCLNPSTSEGQSGTEAAPSDASTPGPEPTTSEQPSTSEPTVGSEPSPDRASPTEPPPFEPPPEAPPVELAPEPTTACQAGEERACYTGPAGTRSRGECKDGVQRCNADGSWAACQGDRRPSKEVCDGKDHDCDGTADNGCGCTTGSSRQCYGSQDSGCRKNTPTTFSCRGSCKAGTQSCVNGQWDACKGDVYASLELCNDKDDDCDGQVDEDFPKKGSTCAVGVGACRKSGRYACSGDFTLRCSATAGSAAASETCGNNIDDNCNGRVDETCTCTSGTRSCGSTVGECSAGTQTCNATTGAWSTCSGRTTSRSEICDDKDNDCDGQIDEGCCLPNKVHASWQAHTGRMAYGVTGLRFGSSSLTSGADDQQVVLWRLSGSRAIKGNTFQHNFAVTSLAVTSRFVATALADGNIQLWYILNRTFTLSGHTAKVNSISFPTDDGWNSTRSELASASDDGTIRIWRTSSSTGGSLRETLTGHTAGVTAVAFTPDGSRLASGSKDKTVRFWDPDRNNALQTMSGHQDEVLDVAVTDDRTVASVSRDRTVRLWDGQRGTAYGVLYTAAAPVFPTRVRFDPRGLFLAVAFSDGTVRIWGRKNASGINLTLAATLSTQGKTLWSLDWSTTNFSTNMIAAGDETGQVFTWVCP